MTAKRPNKRQRLSETKTVATFTPSDYNSAPLTVKMVGGALILPSATLAQADAPPEALAERSGQTLAKKSACPCRTRPARLRPRLDPDRPTTAPETPGGSIGGRICKPHRHGNGPQRATGNAIHGNGGAQTPRISAGRAQDERKIKPGEFTPGKRKGSTEPPRRRHAKRAGGRQQSSKTPQQGRTPTRAKRKPAGSVAPGGFELL